MVKNTVYQLLEMHMYVHKTQACRYTNIHTQKQTNTCIHISNQAHKYTKNVSQFSPLFSEEERISITHKKTERIGTLLRKI